MVYLYSGELIKEGSVRGLKLGHNIMQPPASSQFYSLVVHSYQQQIHGDSGMHVIGTDIL